MRGGRHLRHLPIDGRAVAQQRQVALGRSQRGGVLGVERLEAAVLRSHAHAMHMHSHEHVRHMCIHGMCGV